MLKRTYESPALHLDSLGITHRASMYAPKLRNRFGAYKKVDKRKVNQNWLAYDRLEIFFAESSREVLGTASSPSRQASNLKRSIT